MIYFYSPLIGARPFSRDFNIPCASSERTGFEDLDHVRTMLRASSSAAIDAFRCDGCRSGGPVCGGRGRHPGPPLLQPSDRKASMAALLEALNMVRTWSKSSKPVRSELAQQVLKSRLNGLAQIGGE